LSRKKDDENRRPSQRADFNGDFCHFRTRAGVGVPSLGRAADVLYDMFSHQRTSLLRGKCA